MSASKFIGQPLPRLEDGSLLSGAGKYVDDIHLPGTLEAAFVRSSFAHARISSIDTSVARAAPGVLAVLTYDDIRPQLTVDRLPLELRPEPLPPNITPFPLANKEVVFAGEAVAVVVAESRYLAEDATALVEVDYEPLPAVADCLAATLPAAPPADTRQASNIVKEFRQAYGSVGAAFDAARHRASLHFKTHRGCAHPIEGRAKAASEMLEVGVKDLELEDGRVQVQGVPNLGVSFVELGTAMAGVPGYKLPGDLPPGLEHSHNFLGTSLTYSGAVIAVELEVDPETGHVNLHKIVVVNDSGVVINPNTVRGQVIGSVVHTLGNTLFEWMGYDEHAQPVTTTFAEYLIPTAPEIPRIEVILLEYPGKNNPLGVKGAGETACIPVPGAIASAIENALESFGVRIAEFPLSPARIFELLSQGHAGNA